MSLTSRIHDWFDARPGEGRSLCFSFFGAFFVLAALTLARALREACYLAEFPVETLPYITAAYAFLCLPAVTLFTRLLAGHSPRRVLSGTVLLLIAGLLALWPLAARGLAPRVFIVSFYLWTALGILLVSSGFWVVTAELFPLRSAKRLFGLISTGGTAGAMAMGLSLDPLTARLDITGFLPLLIALLAAFLVMQNLLPREAVAAATEEAAPRRSSAWDKLGMVWKNGHLRGIALMVAAGAMASTLLDFQFKEAARASFSDEGALTGFFGAFYGWTGAAALLFQLFVATRLTSGAGIGTALAVLPLVLLFGSAAFALLPGLILVCALRGADNSLRKSLFRPMLEYLYVPLAAGLRRRTKTFVDSVIDPLAEGLGALLILIWVTWLALPSRLLSLFIIILAGAFLVLSRRMNRQYMRTLITRLEEARGPGTANQTLDERRLLSGTFSRLDLRDMIGDPEAFASNAAVGSGEVVRTPDTRDLLARLRSKDAREVREALRCEEGWTESCIEAAIQLLARDALMDEAVVSLQRLAAQTMPRLERLLNDESCDFVIRRRIPRILAHCGGEEANAALLAALTAARFEVRYRSAIALARRRHDSRFTRSREAEQGIWEALLMELRHDRPVWELQRLLDTEELSENDLVKERIGLRGELSLEHVFRLLGLVLDPEPVRAAFNGIVHDDEQLRSFALEYLEQVLPPEVKRRLWDLIGDLSEKERLRSERPLNQVVQDLMNSRATLFAGEMDREALLRLIKEREQEGQD